MTTLSLSGPAERVIHGGRARDAVFIRTLPDQAGVAAAAARSRRRTGRPLGPLDGMPIAVKDNIDVAGAPTTNGSLVAGSDEPAPRDAAVVRRLREHGAVLVGKTNLSELAFSGLGTNEHFGTPVNPLSAGEPLVAGGSSSGSAVAVAEGLVPLAVGTDTSGSVRVPAAFCGIAGYKASEGRVPLSGVRRLSDTLDSIGLLAASTAVLRQAAATLGVRTSYAAAPRLVVPVDAEVVEACDPAVRLWFEEQVGVLERVDGVVVERRRLPVLRVAQELMDEHGTIVAADALARHGHLLDAPGGGLDPAVVRRLRAAAGRGDGVGLVRDRMAALRATLERQLAGALLLCPTVRHLPPTIREVTGSPADFDRLNASTLRTTMLLSYLGMPGVSLPLGAGRPAGLLISGPHLSDGQVLGAASIVETTME
jgi:aspartyl-tRNA(Asn)/glutamyl-tRNA(Gln) amidotransferase subunit A